MCRCGEGSIVGEGIAVKRAITQYCNSWGCENCAPRRRKRLIAEIIGGNPNKFITLTCKRREGETRGQMAARMSDGWRRTRRTLLQTKVVESLEFTAVFEKHKSGNPHLHIVARCEYIDQHRLSEIWEQHTGDPVVHIEKIDTPKKAAYYIGKYLSKDNVRFGTCKRYWKSKHYAVKTEITEALEAREPLAWKRHNKSYMVHAEAWEMEGWLIEFPTNDSVTARAPP